MRFFDKLKGKTEDYTLSSPMCGRCISLKEVPDEVFSGCQLGKGIAIIPRDGHIYAPVDGVISMIFSTGHALGLTTRNGTEILLHIGLDTVELNGEPFIIKVEKGQKVVKGELLIIADLEKIEQAGKSTITPLIICNSDDYTITEENINKDVEIGDILIRYVK